MEKILVLSFKKVNGKDFKFNVVFPGASIAGQDITALANIIIQKNVFEFKDNSPVKELEKAYYQQVVKQDIALN